MVGKRVRVAGCTTSVRTSLRGYPAADWFVLVRKISLSSRTRTAFVSHTHLHVNSHTDTRTHKQTHAYANEPLKLCRHVGKLRDLLPVHRTTTDPADTWHRSNSFKTLHRHRRLQLVVHNVPVVLQFPLFPNWPPTALHDPFGVVHWIIINIIL